MRPHTRGGLWRLPRGVVGAACGAPSTQSGKSLGPQDPKGKRSAVLTYRYTPGYAMHVTFFEGRKPVHAFRTPGADIFVRHSP